MQKVRRVESPRSSSSSSERFEVRCWTACVNQSAVITGEKGRNELMDINGCGFDGGKREGRGETDGKDEKAEKITHETSHCQMKGWRDGGFLGLMEERSLKKGVSATVFDGRRDLG